MIRYLLNLLTSKKTDANKDQPIEKPHPLPGKWIIFSGAGLSQESGLATYRAKDGLWANHDVKAVCHAATWRANRQQVTHFYEARWEEIKNAAPHAGHAWCAEMQKRGAILITQNIDTLLERAGAERVLHIHGRIDQWQCFACEHRWVRYVNQPLRCPACDDQDIRVDVVFFGERAKAYPYTQHLLGTLQEEDTLVVVGTSGQVFNPILWLQGNPRVIVVDPEPYKIPCPRHNAEFIEATASTLPEIFKDRI